MTSSASTSEYNRPADGRQLEIALFQNRLDRTPKPAPGAAWAKLRLKLSQHRERESKDGPCWSPVRYAAGATRGVAGVESVHLLVLDLDGTDLPYEALTGFTWLAHTTHSHEPSDPRWRLVLPLTRPVAAADWPDVIERAYAFFGGVADMACRDASRLYYLPSHRPGEPFYVEHGDGRWLDPDTLPAVEPRAQVALSDRLDVPRLLEHGAPEGERDRALFRLAAKLRRADVPYEDASYLVSKAAARCSPPFAEWHKPLDSAYGRYVAEPDGEPREQLALSDLSDAFDRTMRNPTLKAPLKLVALRVAQSSEWREQRGHSGPFRVTRWTLADQAGVSESTVGAALTDLQDLGALTKRQVPVPDGGSVLELALAHGTAGAFLAFLATVDAYAVLPKHGGKQEPRAPRFCPSHPNAPVRDRSTCERCGLLFHEAERKPRGVTVDFTVDPEDAGAKPREQVALLDVTGLLGEQVALSALEPEPPPEIQTPFPAEHTLAEWRAYERLVAGESP